MTQHIYKTLQEKPFLIAGPCMIESEDLVMQKVGTNVQYKVTED